MVLAIGGGEEALRALLEGKTVDEKRNPVLDEFGKLCSRCVADDLVLAHIDCIRDVQLGELAFDGAM